MPPVYLLNAAQCPAPYVASGINDPNAASPATPLVLPPASPGQTSGVSYLINRISRHIENVARYGGGAYAVASGLDLEVVSGRTVRMTIGVQMCDAAIPYTAIKTVVVPDNLYDVGDISVRGWLWLSRAGSLTVRTDLTQPATPAILLGSVRTNAGAVVDIDYSGRLVLGGNGVYRQTADAAAPADTPPASLRFWNRSATGLYYWDGASYVSPLAFDSGALPYKPPCRAASTANVNTATPGASLDGVALNNGDRILLKDQTTGSQNGIWVWHGAASALTRPADFDASADVKAGLMVPVSEGDTQQDTVWTLVTNDTVTLGTTALVFGQLSAVFHEETFTVQFSPGAGAVTVWECDFSARGTFLRDYLVKCAEDETGALVSILADRTSGTFRFQILVASDAPSGSYGYSGDVELVFTLTGWQWVVGGTPAATPTLTQDTHNYSGAEGGRTRETLSANGTLVDGRDVIHEIDATAGHISVDLPAAPQDNDLHKIVLIADGGSHHVAMSPSAGQTLLGGAGSLIMTAQWSSVDFYWDDADNDWRLGQFTPWLSGTLS